MVEGSSETVIKGEIPQVLRIFQGVGIVSSLALIAVFACVALGVIAVEDATDKYVPKYFKYQGQNFDTPVVAVWAALAGGVMCFTSVAFYAVEMMKADQGNAKMVEIA